jgi:hypothetical protein
MDFIIEKEKKIKGEKKQYFTKETENAIIKYNNEPNPVIKNKIYQEYIHYPFYKLTQNIIHTFKFYHTEVENLEDLQHEVITFLMSKIHLFNPEKGAKAYSYFGTIVKRYLILSNQKNYNKKINFLDIDSITNPPPEYDFNTIDSPFNLKKQNDLNILIDKNEIFDEDGLELETYNYNEKLSKFIDQYTEYCSENIYILFPKKNDAQIADAILELFRKRSNINIFNKKALYIYIREIIEVKTPKITKISKELYNIFKKKYKFYIENGYFEY